MFDTVGTPEPNAEANDTGPDEHPGNVSSNVSSPNISVGPTRLQPPPATLTARRSPLGAKKNAPSAFKRGGALLRAFRAPYQHSAHLAALCKPKLAKFVFSCIMLA